jgi:hypothetical protein
VTRLVAFAVLFASLLVALPARSEDDVKAARDQFIRGTQLVKEADWAGALAAFEESSKLRPHPVTTFNVGACLRSMGQYTRARRAFAMALEENGKTPGADLSAALTEETKRYVAELDKLVAHLDLTIVPDEAQIAVDGRPLDAGANGTLVAGILPAGPGKPAPKGKFRVVVDPGTHVVTISRAGFADAVSRETLAPGATVEKSLVLDRLPALLRVTSNIVLDGQKPKGENGAQVLVDGADVGLTPVDINRPAGKYKVIVKKSGFLPFETNASADPGQNVNVTATLREDKPTLTQRWWFWTGVGVLVVGAATTTYFLTRPDPERPAVDGGGLNWAVRHP